LSHDQVSDRESDLFRHSQDESSQQRVEPEVVCFPESTEDVVTIVNIARAYLVLGTPYWSGSGLEGQRVPLKIAIAVLYEILTQMYQVMNVFSLRLSAFRSRQKMSLRLLILLVHIAYLSHLMGRVLGSKVKPFL